MIATKTQTFPRACKAHTNPSNECRDEREEPLESLTGHLDPFLSLVGWVCAFARAKQGGLCYVVSRLGELEIENTADNSRMWSSGVTISMMDVYFFFVYKSKCWKIRIYHVHLQVFSGVRIFPTKNPSLDGRGFPIRVSSHRAWAAAQGRLPKSHDLHLNEGTKGKFLAKPPLFFGYLEDHPTYSKRLVIYGGFEPFITKII